MHTELMMREVEMPELLVVEGGMLPIVAVGVALGVAWGVAAVGTGIAAGIAWLLS